MGNLLDETIEKLNEIGKTSQDVLYVVTDECCCGWSEFSGAADREYDGGYGTQHVNSSLKLVGDDWWLERAEYDGFEWWEFKTKPKANFNGGRLRVFKKALED